ncbi:hypothetical protein [Marmoricola endophyticus]|uniref:hypothetical protein n=1 Tax=Marmoricola endophyticus TaxID=2040280 RepID=UPI001666EC91|nr:hypothetical protein [Marmoricola endophyticus]
MPRLLPPLLAAALLLAGCSSGSGDAGAERSTTPSPSSRPSERPSDRPSGGAGSGRDAVCAKVRAGINAFNAGDLQDTVVEFKEAVPLAEAARRKDSSREARLLLRAVRYYAALPANDYPEASASSLEFQRWKAVTLGLCAPGQDDLSPGPDQQDPAIPA